MHKQMAFEVSIASADRALAGDRKLLLVDIASKANDFHSILVIQQWYCM